MYPSMGTGKRESIFTAEPAQVEQIDTSSRAPVSQLSSSTAKPSKRSSNARAATPWAEQVDSYCDAGYAREDADLIPIQAFDRQ